MASMWPLKDSSLSNCMQEQAVHKDVKTLLNIHGDKSSNELGDK